MTALTEVCGIQMQIHWRCAKLALGIEPGKAYVKVTKSKTNPQFLNVDKHRTFNSVVDTPIQTDVGLCSSKHTNWCCRYQ